MNKNTSEMAVTERINHFRRAPGLNSKSAGELLSLIERKNIRFQMLMNAFIAREQSVTKVKKKKDA